MSQKHEFPPEVIAAVRAMLWRVTRQAAEELERQALELRRWAR